MTVEELMEDGEVEEMVEEIGWLASLLTDGQIDDIIKLNGQALRGVREVISPDQI